MILITGLPNAGKTTFSARFENAYHGDDLRRQGINLWDIIKEDGVVLEGIYNRADLRQKMLRTASRPCVCYWLDITVQEAIRRETRGRKPWFFEMHNNDFQPPTMDEGWDEIIRITAEGSSAF